MLPLLLLLLLRLFMSYPSVFCVKCKSHTDTLGRHTIQLSNNRRALKGVCPVCATETYRFMPEKGVRERETQLSLISSQRKLPTGAERRKSPLVEIPQRDLNILSRLEYLHMGMADKLLHYGVLLVLFGLSIVIGFVICSRFFPNL
ncbi:MAG: hypothetical protein EOP07_03250 [Proteobacteria bacterium]|nr:MAG: hypothetical protein EOP07_03250 [Pseudomonadota bacterium]